jgi:hypothetical protein
LDPQSDEKGESYGSVFAEAKPVQGFGSV